MVGCTDWVYRKLIREQGAELAFCEMLSAEAYIRNAKKSFEIIRTTPEDQPTGAQIMGAEPKSMAEAARRLEAAGFRLIDINIGCPAKKIVRQGAGSALLKDENRFGAIIQAVVNSVQVPVTAKLRVGFEASDETKFVRLLKIAEGEGIAALAIHGRTQEQRFSGQVDLSPIRLAKSTVRLPIIGNGDVTNGEKALQMIQETGCDAVMIGRGSLGNPWIFREIIACLEGRTPLPFPDFDEEVSMLIRHAKEMVTWHGEKLGLLRMRKLAPFYFKESPRVLEFRRKAVRAGSLAELESALEVFERVLV
jgi:nifR3 family TIM-barrel protein